MLTFKRNLCLFWYIFHSSKVYFQRYKTLLEYQPSVNQMMHTSVLKILHICLRYFITNWKCISRSNLVQKYEHLRRNYFHKKNSLQMFDWILNTPLSYYVQYSGCNLTRYFLNKIETELLIFRCLWKHWLRWSYVRIKKHKLKLQSHKKYRRLFLDKIIGSLI